LAWLTDLLTGILGR